MKSLTFVEFCAGLGGTRAGLEAAGWKCAFALDNDRDVVAAHRIAFSDCQYGDVRALDANAIPSHDLLVAGFPCQPFSSSGLRTGFSHHKGNVFEAVSQICAQHEPKAILLENVRGLLSNAYGHTFASVLRALLHLGYGVTWGALDAAWFGAPQSRPRVFIVAMRDDGIRVTPSAASGATWDVLGSYVAPVGPPRTLDLEAIVNERTPRVGFRRPVPQTPFGIHGLASGGGCWTWDRVSRRVQEKGPALGDVVCPEFASKDAVRSVRYWGHSGVTRPYFKKESLAHCLGTNIGAGPTFGIDAKKVASRTARHAVLQYANWVREERRHLVFRLVPERAALLFGPLVEPLQKALTAQSTGVTKQYEMLGNLVVPEIARRIGMGIRTHLKRDKGI